jgi:hypothetical protein
MDQITRANWHLLHRRPPLIPGAPCSLRAVPHALLLCATHFRAAAWPSAAGLPQHARLAVESHDGIGGWQAAIAGPVSRLTGHQGPAQPQRLVPLLPWALGGRSAIRAGMCWPGRHSGAVPGCGCRGCYGDQGGGCKPPRGRALFRPSHLAEIANCLPLAKRRRFGANGADHMMAVAAGLTWRGAGDANNAVSESSFLGKSVRC